MVQSVIPVKMEPRTVRLSEELSGTVPVVVEANPMSMKKGEST